jgi:hypothetical protein
VSVAAGAMGTGSPVRSGLRDGLPAGWSDAVRFCPSCGLANDNRSLTCGYRDADQQVVYWWCHGCHLQALVVALDVMIADVVEVTEVDPFER